MTPEYLSNMLQPVSQTHSLILRSSENGTLYVPKSRTTPYNLTFSYSAHTIELPTLCQSEAVIHEMLLKMSLNSGLDGNEFTPKCILFGGILFLFISKHTKLRSYLISIYAHNGAPFSVGAVAFVTSRERCGTRRSLMLAPVHLLVIVCL